MPVTTFTQDSRLGRRIYQIREDALFISVPRAKGGFDEYRADLRGLDPEYQRRVTRDWALLTVPGSTLVFALAALLLLKRAELPEGAVPYFTHWPLILAASSLILVIKGLRRTESYLFKDYAGRPAVAIIREPEQAGECADFIAGLVAHIGIAQANLTATERARTLQALDRELSPMARAGREVPLWLLALVFGMLAAGVPWLPGAAGDPSLFFIIFPLCVCGVAAGYFSFMKREPRRWWGVLGALLSLVPPFFY
jgi:hypothetical protein